MVTIKIYTLTNPLDNSVFYIGKTTGLLEIRLRAHIIDREANYAKMAIIKEIVDKGRLPEIYEIESHICENEEQELIALKREGFWINYYKENGYNICNGETKPRLLSDYQKTQNKSKTPSGIRFNLKQLQFLKEKEGIITNQKVVDFLLAKYYWEAKLANPDYIKGSLEEI